MANNLRLTANVGSKQWFFTPNDEGDNIISVLASSSDRNYVRKEFVNAKEALGHVSKITSIPLDEIRLDLPREINNELALTQFGLYFQKQYVAVRNKDKIDVYYVNLHRSFAGLLQSQGLDLQANDYKVTLRNVSRPLNWDIKRHPCFQKIINNYQDYLIERIEAYCDKTLVYCFADTFEARIVEGHISQSFIDNGKLVVTKISDEIITVTAPRIHIIEEIEKELRQEIQTSCQQEVIDLFKDQTDDVMQIKDYRNTAISLCQFDAWKRLYVQGKYHKIFWTSSDGNTALIVRANSFSNEIHCPVEYRGHLIGKGGIKIKMLAKDFGHRFLKVV